MRHIRFVPVRSLVAVALLAGSTGAMAQSTTSERSSWIPGTHEGYVGFNAGVSDFTNACIAGYPCDDRDVGFKVYTGGQLYKMLGLEAGYVNFGSAERAGGVQRAQGLNVSLVARAPITEAFNVFGKVGTTYGWTDRSSIAPGVTTGNEDGFGLSYGAGIGWDATDRMQVVLEWDRHRLNFAGGENNINMYTAGLRFKF